MSEKRPDYVTDAHLEFLDELRESGVTNMWGSPAYIRQEFGFDEDTAFGIFSYWMKTFGGPR